MVCHKTTMEYLLMNDQVERKVVKTWEANRYSGDLDYRPEEFKNETIKILTDARVLTCGTCSGHGKVTCNRCSGNGSFPCDTTTKCDRCGGKGERSDTCGACGGTRKVVTGQGRFGPIEGSCRSCTSGLRMTTCSRCEGRGRVTCSRCGGTGLRGCDRCDRSGIVQCKNCGGEGKLVHGNFITRKFVCSTKRTYQLTGLAADEFKNGLAEKHFKSMPGNLVLEEFQTPATNDIVYQKHSGHTYDVLSHHYTYGDTQFCLNRITSDSASKYVGSGVPWSKIKAVAASGVFLVAVVAVAAALVLL